MKKTLLTLALLATCAPPISAFAQDTNAEGGYSFDFGNNETVLGTDMPGDSTGTEDAEKEKAKQTPINPFDKKYRPLSLQNQKAEEGGSLRSGSLFLDSFIRPAQDKNDEIILRLTSPGTLSGCLKGKKMAAKVSYEGTNARIVLGGGKFNIDSDTPRYALYTCAITSNSATIDIALSKQKLIEKKIKGLFIATEDSGARGNIELEVSETHIIATGNLSKTEDDKAKAKGRERAVFWFFPENTLMLEGQGLPDNSTNRDRIRSIAQARGLSPVDSVLKDYTPEPASGGNAKVPVIDDKGILRDKLDDGEIPFALIKTTEPFFGPNGQKEREISKAVVARRLLPSE